MNSNRRGTPFIIVGGAVVLLFILSLVPWHEITEGRIKNFNLLGDLFPSSTKTTAEETIDPELLAAMAENENDDTLNQRDNSSDVSEGETVVDIFNEIESPKEPVDNVADDGTIILEDYSPDNSGLRHFRNALAHANNRPVRIAVIGDSYIEGDIFTMDVREMLQKRFGGAGVGYMPASSELVGFRSSVIQKCNGWEKHEIRRNSREDMKTIQGEYFTSKGNASSSFKGVSNPTQLDTWNNTMVLAVAPNGGSLTLTIDEASETLELEADDRIQSLTVPGNTTSAQLTATTGVEIAGVYLNNISGIAVDNMSLRGNSGQTHRKLSVERAAQMRPYADYDLIVVEYGINALSSQQSNYEAYKKLMIQTILRLRQCYPNADIVMMGIGDRGQKSGSVVKSVPTSANMVTAQRDAARHTGILFWDTRQAMGGADAVVEWREKGLINPDYIHLNRKGGKALAELFVKALYKAI